MKIFLDMDGVLCDFVSGCIKAHGMNIRKEEVKNFYFFQDLGLTEEQFWGKIGSRDFWANLFFEPDAWSLLNNLQEYCDSKGSSIEIVTRPNYNYPECVLGKLDWLSRLERGTPKEVTFTENKYLLAGNGILIDDSDRNVRRFREHGGKAILYPQYWNENAHLIRNRLSYVQQELKKYSQEFIEPPDDEVIVTDPVTGAKKGTKLARYDLIPTGPLRLLAKHFGEGAKKYEERNWEKGYKWSNSFAALNRHLWDFWDGKDLDEDGRLNLTAVIWHSMALAEFFLKSSGVDDRPCKKK